MGKTTFYKPGTKFNHLTIIENLPLENKKTMVRCRCDCKDATIIDVRIGDLKRGHTKSCGCHKRMVSGNRNKKHGLRNHPIYAVWYNMMARCYNFDNKDYNYYGGRGIIVFDEWHDITNFYSYAINSGWEKGLEIDRVDNDSSYTPENCRWVSHKKNCRNRKTNYHLTIKGETKLLVEWEEKYGLSKWTIKRRIKDGWQEEDLLLPPKTRKPKYNNRISDKWGEE